MRTSGAGASKLVSAPMFTQLRLILSYADLQAFRLT